MTSTTTAEHAIVFVDLETTGLDSERDAITEMAWVYDFTKSDGGVLTLENHYYARYDGFPSVWSASHTQAWPRDRRDGQSTQFNVSIGVPEDSLGAILAAFFEQMVVLSMAGTRPIYIAGAVPSFDDRFLRKQFRELPYHYHIIDVEAQAMGVLGWPVPRSLGKLRAALGLAGENEQPHDALADALEARAIYRACLQRSEEKNP